MQMNDNNEPFWILLEKEYQPAMMFCRKLMSDRDRGDDLFQDSLVLACSRFGTLRNTESFRPWLYRIIVNCFKMTVRRPWWKKRMPLTEKIETTLKTSDLSGRLTARRWLERAFKAVSPEEQAMITLYEMEQWTVSELATLYGKSEGAVKVGLYRTKKKMKKALDKWLPKSSIQKEKILTEEDSQCFVAKPNGD